MKQSSLQLTVDKAEYFKALEGSTQRVHELSESAKSQREHLSEAQRQNAQLLERNLSVQATNSDLTSQVQQHISENQRLIEWIREIEEKKVTSDDRV